MAVHPFSLTLLVLFLLVGSLDGQAPDAHIDRSVLAAERAVREHACLACHRAEGAIAERLAPVPAPNLHTAGPRYTAAHLSGFLADPWKTKPGTRMPNVLAGVPAEERADSVEALVHFLASRGGKFDRSAIGADPREAELGRRLFDEIGCRACHHSVPGWRTRLAAKTNYRHVSDVIHNPAELFPSGFMPSLRLSEKEVRAIALYLLEDQSRDADGNPLVRMVTGLRERYYEGVFSNCGPDLERATPVRDGVATKIGLPVGHREEYFGVALDGEIDIPKQGIWTFTLTSDDGSRLWIDEAPVIEHDGMHSPSSASGTLELDAGWHSIRVTMFEYGGGEELSLLWSGPDQPNPAEIPVKALRVRSAAYQPSATDQKIDRTLRSQGQRLYLSLGCAACHDRGVSAERAPTLAALPAEAVGCLDPDPPADSRAPRFPLDPSTRDGIVALLRSRDAFRVPADDATRLAISLDSLGCKSCHAREGFGGPTADTYPRFTGTAELGDEGRLPPDLTGVGAKLRRDWIEKVIGVGAPVRPYMNTRMPEYSPEIASDLAELFHREDGGDDDGGIPAFTDAAVEAGRLLSGGDGFRCIDCHDFAGHPSLGEPAIDLATTGGRLQPKWYLEYMLDPQSKRPGTRMPSFWAEGIELFPDVLDGTAASQIAATWSYLALGDAAPLPAGLVVDRSAYDIIPVEEPILFGAFFEGLSGRVICCGYPERISIAYDAENAHLAKAWRGDFINARGTWEGRAGRLETPEGSNPFDFPPGDAVAVLAHPDDAWPKISGREAGWRHRGVRKDADRRPVFRRAHAASDTIVEEWITPRFSTAGASIVRNMVIVQGVPRGDAPADGGVGKRGVELRIATSKQIFTDENGFRTQEGLHLIIRGAEARIVEGSDGAELRASIPPGTHAIEVEVVW